MSSNESACETTPAVLNLMARESPGRTAVIAGTRPMTFGQLREKVRCAAAGLIDRGVEPGDRVVIWQPNTVHWVVACLAIHYAGATVVPLNTRYTAREAGDILRRVRARVLITADRFAGVDRAADIDPMDVPALTHVIRIASDDDGDSDIRAHADWTALLKSSDESLRQADKRAVAVKPNDLSDIVFTSGTTGVSKGVMCSHRQSLSATAAVWSASGGLRSDDRYLCINPFFHTFGFRFGMVACLQAGATLVPAATVDPELAMARISEHRISVFPGPPTIYQMLLDHPCRERYDLSSWRLAVTGSTILPRALIERMQNELDVATVVTGYGLTEASGYGTTTCPGDDPVTVATTVGRPIPGFELCIGKPDESGVGEVLLRGPNVMLGYLDDRDATAEAVDAQGWLHTGDLGRLDHSGNLRIVGRIKDMYINGGMNVYPAEVEQVLAGLDGVVESAVVGVPDGRMGEVGRAFIVSRPGVSLDESLVKAYARNHLADFKVPQAVSFVDELPRNAIGKVLKNQLVHVDCPVGRRVRRGSGGPPSGIVEAWVADAWQTLLDVDRPGRLDRFTDLGGDSVAAAEFCRMLNSEFGVTISVDRFAALQTISSVVAELEPGAGRGRQLVATLRADGSGPICVMVPGLAGNTWTFRRIADGMKVPCDVLAVSLVDVGAIAGSSIRSALRTAIFQAIRRRSTASRPIVLVGYSFGGLIAADLACWLGEQGVRLGRLLLIDPKPLHSRPPRGRITLPPIPPELTPVGQLAAEIDISSRRLATEYLDGLIRLPRQVPVACIRSRETVIQFGLEPTLYSSPSVEVQRHILEMGHIDLVSSKAGVVQLAEWLDRQIAG